VGPGPGNFTAGLFPENFQPDFPEKFLRIFVEKISGKIKNKNFIPSHQNKKSPLPLQKPLFPNHPFFRLNNLSNPGTYRSPIPQNSQTTPKLSPV
jgi:hypothetical protein